MNLKKSLMIFALGFAASAQAQQAAPATQPAAQPATNVATPAAQAPAQTAAPVAQTAATQTVAPEAAQPATEAAPVPDGTPAPAAPAEGAATAAAETAPVENATAEAAPANPAENAEPLELPPVVDGTPAPAAEAPADSAANVATATDSSAAEVAAAPVASDSTAAATDSSANATNTATAVSDSAVAQTLVDSSATAAPAQDIAEKTAPATAPILNVIHGNAYNLVGNEAAAATIGGDLSMPHKMRGHKLGYFDPIEEQGVVSFGDARTYFIALDNASDLGVLTLGMAFSNFGFSLEAALSQEKTQADYAGTHISTKTQDVGNFIGAGLSAKFGNVEMGLNGHYMIPEKNEWAESNIDNSMAEKEVTDFGGQLTIANCSNPWFAWSAGVSVNRHNSKISLRSSEVKDIDGVTYLVTTKIVNTDTSANVLVVPTFNVGSNVLAAEKGRIFIGLNTMVPLQFNDKIKDQVDFNNSYSLLMAPNILGEVALGKYMMAFGSATHVWDVYSYREVKTPSTTFNGKLTQSGTTLVNLGARFQYEMAAVELAFTKEFLENPFGAFSSTDGIAISLGAFINF